MPGNGKVPQVAYLYEEDDEGKPVLGSEQSARKERERPKLSQRDSQSRKSTRNSYSDSGKYDGGISPGTKAIEGVTMTEKAVNLERRKSSASAGKSPKKSSKPPSAHENRGLPKMPIPRPTKDDPSHFGISTPTSRAPPVVSQMTQQIPLRPRAVTTQTYPARPVSFHAAYPSVGYANRPPLSNSAYYQQPYAFPPPSYPPPSASYFQYTRTPQAGSEYFSPPVSTTPVSARPLHERFGTVEKPNYDPIPRTSSAFGARGYSQQLENAYDDGYISASEGPVRRRVSIPRPPIRAKQEIDYTAMPPPPRPGILRRPATEYHELPDPPSRRDSRDSRSVYRDDPPPVRRPSLRRNSVSYDTHDSDRVSVFETANAGRRRTSYYGPSTESNGSNDYVGDRVRQAQTYQEEVAGPSPIPLTAEVLKRQQRRQAGSSRSTKSSGSRDESDYRKSATTRTTRSGSDENSENVTIKVTGSARVMVGRAQIDCVDGSEIEIKHQKAIRNGSERGSEYGGTQRDRIEDRRSRVDRPQGRSRMSSKSNQSYTRTTPQWI